jgi:hypothetical protein
MKRGRFSKLRQKRYSSDAGRLMVTLFSTFVPRSAGTETFSLLRKASPPAVLKFIAS